MIIKHHIFLLLKNLKQCHYFFKKSILVINTSQRKLFGDILLCMGRLFLFKQHFVAVQIELS